VPGAAALPAYAAGTDGLMNSGNFGVVTTGAGASFGAHALTRTTAARRYRRITDILSRRESTTINAETAEHAEPSVSNVAPGLSRTVAARQGGHNVQRSLRILRVLR
jgi:hypothetical protein